MSRHSPTRGASIRLSPDAALALLRRYAPVMDFIVPHDRVATQAVESRRSPSSSTTSDCSLPALASIPSYSDIDDTRGSPPVGEPRLRPVHPLSAETMPVLDDNAPGECSLEQYVCFVYRGRAIWLRTTVIMEDDGCGQGVSHVEVRCMTQTHDDDPALRRIGLVIERGLQDGMRREILSAIRQAVNLQYRETE